MKTVKKMQLKAWEDLRTREQKGKWVLNWKKTWGWCRICAERLRGGCCHRGVREVTIMADFALQRERGSGVLFQKPALASTLRSILANKLYPTSQAEPKPDCCPSQAELPDGEKSRVSLWTRQLFSSERTGEGGVTQTSAFLPALKTLCWDNKICSTDHTKEKTDF